MTLDIGRRGFLKFGLAASAALVVRPTILFANAATNRRFVFILQRGAADGLNTVVPVGDPAYAALRGELAIDLSEAHGLGDLFALHPSLGGLAGLYARSEALFVQAVALPYRGRSHFDGQNVLETGAAKPYEIRDGWLNRLVSMLPASEQGAFAYGTTVPLVLRGQADVASFAPSDVATAPDDLIIRAGRMYEGDAQLEEAWKAAVGAREVTGDLGAGNDPDSIGRIVGTMLARPDGPRIAVIETSGWDTHQQQGRRLARLLSGLDAMIGGLHELLAAHWADSVVLVATEFGRTAAANGTHGTDHGTGAAAMLIGGAVNGGRVLADWPGLGNNSLFEGRDLRPTLDLHALIAGVAAETYGLDPNRVARTLFPGAVGGSALSGIVRV